MPPHEVPHRENFLIDSVQITWVALKDSWGVSRMIKRWDGFSQCGTVVYTIRLCCDDVSVNTASQDCVDSRPGSAVLGELNNTHVYGSSCLMVAKLEHLSRSHSFHSVWAWSAVSVPSEVRLVYFWILIFYKIVYNMVTRLTDETFTAERARMLKINRHFRRRKWCPLFTHRYRMWHKKSNSPTVFW